MGKKLLVGTDIFDKLIKSHKLQYGTADASNVENALITIMRMMNAVYEAPVILLIDEYDVPLAKARSNGYYQKMLDVIRSIMSISLKTNEYLKFAVVTGCLRIPFRKERTGQVDEVTDIIL